MSWRLRSCARSHRVRRCLPAMATASRISSTLSRRVGAMGVILHPSVEIVRSPHPIVTIWATNSGERALMPIEDWCGEDALIARPHFEVGVHLLPVGGAEFLLALAAGRSLGEAAQHAIDAQPEFSLTENVAGLIRCGLVARITPAAVNDQQPLREPSAKK
jgi:hypothetical protein